MSVLTTSEVITEVIHKLEVVLNKEHQDKSKKIVKYYPSEKNPTRLNFACPYCGDSSQNLLKKRGNLWTNRFEYHCFNCGKHRDAIDFFSDFNVSLHRDIKFFLLDFKREETQSLSFDKKISSLDNLKRLAVPISMFKEKGLVSPLDDTECLLYLRSRCLDKFHDNFLYDKKTKKLWILNKFEDKVVGIQVRSLKVKNYLSYNITEIYLALGAFLKIDEQNREQLNSLSLIFGICEVDFNQEFTIFEGPIDRLFVNNSIATTGITKGKHDYDSYEKARYFSDSDKDGINFMTSKIKNKKKVFLWKKFYDECGIPERDRKNIKDLNDIVKYARKIDDQSILLKLEGCFSNNKFDLMSL